MKEPTKELDKRAVSVVCSNSHCIEEVVTHVKQTSPNCIHIFILVPLHIFATGKHVNHGGDTDWKFLRFFISMDIKRQLNSPKNKIIKVEENLNEIVKHCPK